MKDSLYTMFNSMSCIIDFEQSTKTKRFVVKAGFIPELDESKGKNCTRYINALPTHFQ